MNWRYLKYEPLVYTRMSLMLFRSVLNPLAGWLLFSGLTMVPALAQSPVRHSQVPVTELLVLEIGFAQKNRFVVTSDSIRVDFMMGTEAGDARTHYARTLTHRERDWLLASVDQLYLSRLRPTYEGPSDITDGYTYAFSIRKGAYLKETRLFDYSLRPLVIFTRRLNTLLPPTLRLFYNKP